ncbi:putative membrane protein [Neisseria meningitidis 2001073]|nr:putative membrane protein [Neisseria meningitidis 2001073]
MHSHYIFGILMNIILRFFTLGYTWKYICD